MEEHKPSILVIDDEEDVLYCLKNYLGRKGYTIDGALSGEEALKKLSDKNADLILLDVVMPGLKATEVAKVIREKYPITKIIVATAFPKESEVFKINKLMDALLLKPFRLAGLLRKIREVIERPEGSTDAAELATETETRLLFLKAKLLFVEPSFEVYEFLHRFLKKLVKRGQYYELDLATDEKELKRRLKFSKPDIVIFEQSYLDQLDPEVPANILLNSKRTREVISFDLASAVKDQEQLDSFYHQIRKLCIKNGLVEIK
ncbi:response regulator [Candidatus Omnitrophota bacterium]